MGVLASAVAVLLTGCATATQEQKGAGTGAVIGAVIGAVAGAVAGKTVGHAVDPAHEDTYWRDNYRSKALIYCKVITHQNGHKINCGSSGG